MKLLIKKDSRTLSLVAGNIADLYNDGISLFIIMDLLYELPISKNYKESIRGIKSHIKNGCELNEAFNKYPKLYPSFFTSMIAIGENSGKLIEVLKSLEKYYFEEYKIKKVISNSLMYPCFLLILMFSLIVCFSTILIPSFHPMYLALDIKPPKSSELLYSIVQYMKKSPMISFSYAACWGIAIPAICFYIFVKYIINGKHHKLQVVKAFYEYMTMLILYIILKSGVNITKGLDYSIRSLDNKFTRNRLKIVNDFILEGKTLSESLELEGEHSIYTIALIKMGEEGGGLEDRILTAINYLEERNMNKINKGLKAIGPILISIMAVIVAIFIIIFILPVFDSLLGGLT